MQTVNYSLASLVGGEIQIVSNDEGYVRRALHQNISLEEYEFLLKRIRYIGVSDRFRDVTVSYTHLDVYKRQQKRQTLPAKYPCGECTDTSKF